MPVQHINFANSSLRLKSNTSTLSSQTSNADFSDHLKIGAHDGLQATGQLFGATTSFLPGSSLFSAALNDAANNLSASTSSSMLSANNLSNEVSPALQGKNFLQMMEDMQQKMLQANLQLLDMQNKVQHQSQYFQASSNILKTTHETKVNAVRNMK